jgi:hypothetical protein
MSITDPRTAAARQRDYFVVIHYNDVSGPGQGLWLPGVIRGTKEEVAAFWEGLLKKLGMEPGNGWAEPQLIDLSEAEVRQPDIECLAADFWSQQ